MARVSGEVPSPYLGVSQADPTVRLPGACQAMENCITIIPGGTQPRPPLELARSPLVRISDGLPITADPYALFQPVDRGGTDLDIVLMLNREGASVQPYLFFNSTWDPCPCTVSIPALNYLSATGASTKPCQDFRVVTIEDTTFITHRKKNVGLLGTTAPARPFEALIWCKTGGYARKTVVTVTSTWGSYTASFSTADGGTAADALATGTDRLAKALYDGTDPSPTHDTPNPNPLNALVAAHGFTVTLLGSLIYLSHPTVDFTVTVTDDAGSTAVVGVKDRVQRFSDLPEVAVQDFTVQIAQEAAGANNDYFVAFDSTAKPKGVWREVVAPGAPLGIDPATMPLRLYLDSGGNYILDVGLWTGRTVGDDTLAPDPPFTGEPIVDIGWWRGRLLVISPSSAELSASNNPYTFYPTTLAAALASDPISLLPPGKGRNRFRQIATFDERVVITGNKGQAIVGAGDTVAPDVTYIKPLAGASFDDQVPIQTCSSKVYFAAARKKFKAVYELATDRISGQQIPADLSAAVPKYIPETVDRADTLETEYMTVYGSSGSARMIVHTFRADEDAQRVQNAWNAWTLPEGYTCAGYFFKDHRLFMNLMNPEGFFTAAFMDVSPDQTDDGGSLLTYLDLRFTEALTITTYNSGTDQTEFDFTGLTAADGLQAVVRGTAGFGDAPEGYALQVVLLTPTTMLVQGDWTGAALWFGYPYDAWFEPSRFFMRTSDGNTRSGGRLTIKHLDTKVQAGSYMYQRVIHRGRSDKEPYRAIVGGDPQALPVAADPVTISIPIGARNEDLRLRLGSDNHLGFKLYGMEWAGSYTPKATSST